MRYCAAAGLAFLLVAAAPADPSPMSAMSGRWSEHMRSGLVDGTEFWVDDVAEIVPVDADHAYLRFALNFYNGHTCTLAGVAGVEGRELVFHDVTDVSGDGVRCTLHVSRKGPDLHWDDAGTCKSYCGVRGSFLDGSLPGRSHRPITYLPKLKASSTYRDAITAWRTGKPVNP